MTSRKKNKKNKKVNITRTVRIVIIALAVCIVGIGGALILLGGAPDQSRMEILFDAGTILPTTSINGVDVSNMTPAQARISINEQVLQKAEEIAVQLQYTDRIDLLDAAIIGVYPNADDTIREAMQEGRQGGITQRKNMVASGTVKSLTLSYTYDEDSLEDSIYKAAEQLDTSPIEPEVSVGDDGKVIIGEDGKPVIIEGKDGIDLDVDAFVALVKTAVIDGTFGPVAMPGTPIIPTFSTEEIKTNAQLIGTCYTYFTNASDSGRAMNIKKMCEFLSGQVVLPGEEFSVNEIAGDRTIANGWYMAKGYVSGGRVTDQVGGGICQVSSTLYKALLRTDLEVTARRPHSMPVSYIGHAFDATISSGGPDLKFVNNTEYPVYVVMSVDESNGTASGIKKKLTVDIYGQPLPDGQYIEAGNEDVTVIPYDPLDVVYVLDEDLVRNGHDYIVSKAYKFYYNADGTLIKKVTANTSVYPGNKPYVMDPLTPTPDPFATPGVTLTPGTSPASTPTPTT